MYCFYQVINLLDDSNQNFKEVTLRVCLDLGKLEGKKKSLESHFLSIVWFEESQKEKNREESCKENLSCYEEKIFLPNMRGK